MKSIHTLTFDIQELIRNKEKGWFDDQLAQCLSSDIARRLKTQLGETTQRNTLRLSRMGATCPCALWYSIHHPELAEPLPPWAEVKYSFGHIIEALVLTLARAAGHTVEGEQDELELDGIRGHRDCVIDGCTVDIKSSSSIGFKKFKTMDYSLVDSFGYLDQLDGYTVAAADDPLVKVKDKAYILVVDKQLGHMHLYEHTIREARIRSRISTYKGIVGQPAPPCCECGTVPEGASGNIKLDTRASYSPFKYCCFPSLRTFIYERGPVYLSKVVRKPEVREVNEHGQTVY